ncbi:cytochrome P450 [Peziza echinospora]|nr:cytochrome P450 [Peziza echinospora]
MTSRSIFTFAQSKGRFIYDHSQHYDYSVRSNIKSATLPFLAVIALFSIVIYAALVIVYRSKYHPLAGFPGPKLSAITSLHEFYWNAIRDGRAVFKRKDWHEKYGPVVRINPNEIHLTTPSAYNTIYLKSSPRYTKDHSFYRMFMADTATFGLIDPKAHRGRKELLSPLFSRPNVIRMESIIWETVNNLCDKLRAYAPNTTAPAGRKIGMSTPFKLLTCDIISTFCYGESFYTIPNWKTKMNDKGVTTVVPTGLINALLKSAKSIWFMQRFWLMHKLMVNLPGWVIDLFGLESSVGMRNFINECQIKIEVASAPSTPPADDSEPKNLFTQMLGPSKSGLSQFPFSDLGKPFRKTPTKQELLDEAITVMAAGVEETSSAMLFGLYRVCRELEVYKKLKEELQRIWPDKNQDIGLAELERSVYLMAVIKEILRMSVPVPGKLPRVVPPGGFDIDGWHIPGGTIVSMSAYMQNFHPTAFSEPNRFLPERWIDEHGNARHDLDRYLVSFSKGSRMCIGSNLAMAELYITMGTLWRRFDFELSEEDTNMAWVDRIAAQSIGDLVVRVREAEF